MELPNFEEDRVVADWCLSTPVLDREGMVCTTECGAVCPCDCDCGCGGRSTPRLPKAAAAASVWLC